MNFQLYKFAGVKEYQGIVRTHSTAFAVRQCALKLQRGAVQLDAVGTKKWGPVRVCCLDLSPWY
jgi:hypothetical protein